ncbi:hypothetical protein [Bradyrhizobium sp. Ai1a-2]|uniref:hypothetical protein n=1 Tax=Bradyrhizobium sp. Ai1a-2 TaxID=196490 RepID=UPI00042770CB|nr:hypothetical protein [Bradyrhizobium sp. Ai1a-2]
MTTEPPKNEYPQLSIDAVSIALIREAKRVKDKKQGELRAAYTTADLRGLDTEAAKVAIKLVEDGSEAIDAYFNQFKKVGEYIGVMGKVLAPAQYEMFGPKIGPVPEDERAKREGRAAGFSLDPETSDKSNPYDIGSIKGQQWLRAFDDARQERDSIMSMQPPAPEGAAAKSDGEEDGGA